MPPIVAAPPGFENPPDTTSEGGEGLEGLTTTAATSTTTTTTATSGDVVGTTGGAASGVTGGPAEDSVPQPVIVTSEDTADTVSASSAATGPEQPPRDDLQHSIMALIDFIASR